MNPHKIAQYIKFRLCNLGSENKHHDFEWVCYYVAKNRLYENLMPATGPVTAGGDGGQDFETYNTHIARQPFDRIGDARVIAAEHVAFACTLQKDGIKGKLERDLSTILRSAAETREVYYFLAQDLAVGMRNKYKASLQSTHGVPVQIFDASKIADWLAEPALFWIAEEFLSVGSEFSPPPPAMADAAWYTATCKSLLGREGLLLSHAVFVEARQAARFAVTTEGHEAEVLKWIGFLSQFQVESVPSWVRRKAEYERLALLARLRRSYVDQESAVSGYLEAVDVSNVNDISDSIVILTYAFTFSRQSLCSLSGTDIHNHYKALVIAIEGILDQAETPSLRCELFAMRGRIEMMNREHSSAVDVVGAAMRWWERVFEDSDNAPLFAFKPFADELLLWSERTHLFGALDPLLDRATATMSRFEAQMSLADMDRTRGVSAMRAQSLGRAVRFFFRAREGLFVRDSLYGSLLASMTLAECFRELGCTSAARMCALSAADLAADGGDDEVTSLIPRALLMAGFADFRQGAWMSLACHLRVALLAHAQFAVNPFDMTQHEFVDAALSQMAAAMAVTEQLDTQLFALVAEVIAGYPAPFQLDGWFQEQRPAVVGSQPDELWRRLEAQLTSPPHSDCGPVWRTRWRALGKEWIVECAQNAQSRVLAEEFAAILQILVFELRDTEWMILAHDTRVSVAPSACVDFDMQHGGAVPGDDIRVQIPPSGLFDGANLHERQLRLVALAISVVSSAILVGEGGLNETLDSLHRDGLQRKLFFGRSYDSVYSRWHGSAAVGAEATFRVPPVFAHRSFRSEAHPETDREAHPVVSVIHLALWEQASWTDFFYGVAQQADGQLGVPRFGLIFQDRRSGNEIFARWREEYGATTDAIRLSIVVDCQRDEVPSEYFVVVGAQLSSTETDGKFVSFSRVLHLRLRDPQPFQVCLAAAQGHGCHVGPAFFEGDRPSYCADLQIRLPEVVVKYVPELQATDPERVVFTAQR